MDKREPIFSEHFSVAFMGKDAACDWCKKEDDFLAIECLTANGGWSHVICIDGSDLEELRSLLDRTAEALKGRAK